MSGTLRLKGSTSGYSELQAPAIAGDQTFILPVEGGTLLTTDSPFPTLTLESGTVTSPSLTFEGDSNTGIYSPGANQVAITTGGGQRLFVDFDGSIGIGTDSPGRTLHVLNSTSIVARFESTDTNFGGIELKDANTTADFKVQLAAIGDALKIDTGGTERIRIASGGNVGIGTDSPQSELTVRGSTPQITLEPTADTQTCRLQFCTTDQTIQSTIQSGGSLGGAIKFVQSSSERMRIDSSGNVGIGTDSPDEKLHIREGDIVIGQASGNSTGIRNYIKFGREANPKAAIGFLNDQSNGRGDLIFMNSIVSDGSAFTDSDEVMRIDVNQRLVLGSISPVTSIDYSVCTSGRVQANAVYNATTASAANVVIASNGLFIRSTSSARFKTDIETLENSYADKLLECRPVWYHSIATDDTAHPEWGYYGFIAEEVAEIDPRLVHFTELEDNTLQAEGVQYTQMIPHLVNIVKRQRQQLESLEARLSALETAN